MITSSQMKQLEESSGIPVYTLMENAGREVFRAIKGRADIQNKRILVVCHHGNNGGDGLVAARYLSDEAEVDVLFVGDESRMKKETAVNFKKVGNNEKIQLLDEEMVDFGSYDIIIDAIFGTGITGKLLDKISNLIDDINESNAFKVSVDIPSGLNPDTGEYEKCVNADLIVAMHDLKPGLEKLKGRVVVVDIGLPREG